MKFNVKEISSVIKQEIGRYRSELDVVTVGRVLEVGDGIARIYGLKNAMAGEVLEFEGGIFGEAFNLEEDSIGAVVYGDYLKIKEGSLVRSTGKLLTIPVSEKLIGRILGPLANPIDGGEPIAADKSRPVEFSAPGIAERQPVKQPLQTGLKSIDSMIPIGRGQRELIIGDRKTGKTAIALDAIINQKGKNVICIYVAIGQKESTVAEVVDILRRHGAMDYTIVIAASASESAPLQYVAPYAGCAIGEYFMYEQKRDVLCVYDDLSKHAVAYRELSLLLRRPPGREAYPGDIFYLHSRLLERSVKLSDALGGGSLTALPIVETLEGQVSAYIPTNLISITDGQIYLARDLFLAGVRPAVDVGISVSRVGADAQIPAMKKVASRLRLDLASFRELQDFARLGTELDPAAQAQLERGYRMVELLKQPQYSPMNVADEVITIFVGSAGLIDGIAVNEAGRFVISFLQMLRTDHREYIDQIEQKGELSDVLAEKITSECNRFKDVYSFSSTK